MFILLSTISNPLLAGVALAADNDQDLVEIIEKQNVGESDTDPLTNNANENNSNNGESVEQVPVETEPEIEEIKVFDLEDLVTNETQATNGSEDDEESLLTKGIQPLADDGNDLGSGIFKDVKVKVNDTELVSGSMTEVDITDGLNLGVTFNWALDDNVDLKAGDWAELQLPGSLSGVSSSTTGLLLDGNGDEVGTYEITSEGKLRVIFNDALKGLSHRDGEVGLLLKFDVSEFKDDAYQKIDFGEEINKEFGFKVKPTGELYDIKKTGKVDAKINSKYIDWTLDVNTKLEALADGSVEDIIPDGLVLDSPSVEVYELAVGSEGKLTQGSLVLKPVSTDGGVLKVDLGATDKAYRIKFRTNIAGELNGAYTNTATLKDNGTEKATSSATIDGLSKGSLIEKEGRQNDQDKDQIIWRIYVNKSEETLNNVKVLDTLPGGLTVKNIHYWKSDAWGNFVAYVGEATEFPIDLGDINGAYVFEVKTNIDYTYFDNYTKDHTYINTAELEVDGDVEDSSTAEVKIDRGTVLEKSGKESTSYGDSIISWTLKVNNAKQSIDNAIITDTIGAGLELIEGSLSVYNETTKTTLSASDYIFTKNTDGTFTINLGNISDEYTIKYNTKITNNLGEGQTYLNTGKLSGDNGLDGVGPEDLEKDVAVNPNVANTYTKANEYNKPFDDITYDGLNYAAKTMSWKLTVDAVKEEITELKIKDYFEPASSMKFIKDSLRVVIGDRILVAGTDYTLVDNGVGGFELEFTGSHKPLERAKYEIYFKTSFDADEVLDGKGTLNTSRKYTNHVTFTGKTKDLEGTIKDLNETGQADYWVNETYFNQGQKAGLIDREARTISWQIYTNASGRDLTGGPFSITDTLTAGNQTVNEDVKVYEYSLKADGTPEKGNEITEGFVVTYNEDEKGFVVTFANGVKVPVLVEFTSKINGLSEEWYKNEAVVKDKTGVEKKYPAAVKYDKHNEFVDKSALNADGNNVYTDDELEWKVAINESLSDITNAVFKDTMSDGLVLLKDSIKVYKGSINEDNLVTLTKDAIAISSSETGGTELSIELGDISGRYFVTYTTVVVSTEGKVSNNAKLLGDSEELGGSSSKEFNAKQSTWGTGSGKENRGQIEIIKVDEEGNTIILPAEFELYYLLNGEEQIVTGESKVTENGKIQYGNLPFRTYYLKEVNAPEGYRILDEEKEIVVHKDNKNILLKVENEKIPEKTYAIGDYTWIDENNNGIQDADEPILEGVIVELYDKDGTTKLAETTTDEYGHYIFDELDAGEYKIKFTLTEEQAKKYEFTKKNSGNNSTVDSDADPSTGWTIEIELNDDNKHLEDRDGVKATEGIDPTWDAGVIVRARVSVSGAKTWDDSNNQDGKRPETITINLLADGVEIDSVTVGVDDEWKWSFENLYKTNAGSDKDIVYTIAEEVVADYSTTVDGYNVTNSYTPGKTSVQVTKAWVDNDDSSALRPKEITVKLLANKQDTDKTLALDATNNWTGTFTELDEYKDGQKIEYSVEEISVAGYNNAVTGDATKGFVITNTQKTYALGDYVWIDTNKDGIQDKDEDPLAGVKVELFDEEGKKIAETTTDANGHYVFDELPAGKYKVKFTLTEEQAKKYEFTKKNSGNNSAVDSDADPRTGWTIEIELNDDNKHLEDRDGVKATEGIDPTWDAGVVVKEPVETDKPEDKEDSKETNKPGPSGTTGKTTPQTGEQGFGIMSIVLIMAAFVAIVLRRHFKKENNQ